MVDGIGVCPHNSVTGLDAQCARGVAPADDVDIVGRVSRGPLFPSRPKRGRRSDIAGLCAVPRVFVPNVVHTVAVVVEIEVVLQAVAVEIARPCELVNPAIVVVILIVGAATSAIGVVIGYSIVVVVHGILVDAVAGADRSSGPWVDCGGFDVAVGADVFRVSTLCVIYRSLEDTVVVVVPVEFIENAVVVVVERVCPVASVKALDEVVNSVVIVIEVVQVIDSIVVVILGLGLLKEETVTRI